MHKKDMKKESHSSPKEDLAQNAGEETGARRRALKTALAGGAVIAGGAVPAKWVAPVVDSVMLPAHAQTSQEPASGCTGIDTIRVQSLASDNDFQRYIALVDSGGGTIAQAGPGVGGDLEIEDLEIEAMLPAGTYRVFGDSDGPQTHTIIVTTVGCSEEIITVETTVAQCTHLIATVELPSGVITPESGEIPAGEPDHC